MITITVRGGTSLPSRRNELRSAIPHQDFVLFAIFLFLFCNLSLNPPTSDSSKGPMGDLRKGRLPPVRGNFVAVRFLVSPRSARILHPGGPAKRRGSSVPLLGPSARLRNGGASAPGIPVR